MQPTYLILALSLLAISNINATNNKWITLSTTKAPQNVQDENTQSIFSWRGGASSMKKKKETTSPKKATSKKSKKDLKVEVESEDDDKVESPIQPEPKKILVSFTQLQV
jgi:hypothetical protein